MCRVIQLVRTASAGTAESALASITDGLSSAILAGEKAIDPTIQTGMTWYWDEPFFLGGLGSTARRGLGLVRDVPGNDYKKSWGSAHPGGVQFLFGDGAAGGISISTHCC